MVKSKDFNEQNKLTMIELIRKKSLTNANKALKLTNRYLTIHPKDVDILILKGNILDILGRGKKAYDCYLTVHRYDPLNIQAIIDIGDYYKYVKINYKKAIYYYKLAKKAVDTNNFHTGIYTYYDTNEIQYEIINRITKLYLTAGLLDKAVEYINTALDDNKYNIDLIQDLNTIKEGVAGSRSSGVRPTDFKKCL